MPNQLSQSKKRITLADSVAVLAALESVASSERRTVTDLVKEAIRKYLSERAMDSTERRKLRKAIMRHVPSLPKDLKTPAKVARFKREQRNFDSLLQELKLVDPKELQDHNSLAGETQQVSLISIG